MKSVGTLKSWVGDDESGNHHLTCSSVTDPNLVSRGRSNPKIPRGGGNFRRKIKHIGIFGSTFSHIVFIKEQTRKKTQENSQVSEHLPRLENIPIVMIQVQRKYVIKIPFMYPDFWMAEVLIVATLPLF